MKMKHALLALMSLFLLAPEVRAETISGRVVEEDGAPVEGVRVQALFAGWGPGCVSSAPPEGHPRLRNGLTGADGRFAFDHLEPGWFQLRIEAPGFLQIPALRHKVEAGRSGAGPGAPLEIVLSRGLVLEGIVRDAQDQPVEGATLSWRFGDFVRSDAEGRFRLSGLPPGRHRVSAAHPERGWIEQEVELDRNQNLDLRLPPTTLVRGLVLAHDGGVVEEATLILGDRVFKAGNDGRFQIAVSPGEHEIEVHHSTFGKLRKRVRAKGRPIDLKFRFPRPGRITGRLTGLPPGEKGYVLAENEHGDQEAWKREQDGTFRIENLLPGLWTVTAEDASGRALERRIELKEGNEATVDFRFAPIPRVRGQVLDPQGSPAGKLSVTFIQGDHEVGTRAGSDGTFETHLPEGTWEVWAQREGLGPSPLTSFTVAAEPVEIPPLRLAEPVTVSGRVLGLQPGEVVGWVWAYGGHDKYRLGASTDQENRFEIRDLGPGLWTLETRLGNRTALSTVRIAPGQTAARVDPTFVAGEETLAGQVLGRRGEWVWVEAQRIEEPGLRIYTELSPDDRFEISSLPPGRYRVQVLHRRRDRVRTITEVVAEVPGEPVVIELRERVEGARR